MDDLTKNEIAFVLKVFKNPKHHYNANSISKELKISSMGALKIAKRLEKEEVLIALELGKARYYKLNLSNEYVIQYLWFLLNREAEHSAPYIKYWIRELRKIKEAKTIIVFGSVLIKQERAKDIDVLLIAEQKKFSALKKEVQEINKINPKKIHPIYQSEKDFIKNLKDEDAVILNAIRGTYVKGEKKVTELLR